MGGGRDGPLDFMVESRGVLGGLGRDEAVFLVLAATNEQTRVLCDQN